MHDSFERAAVTGPGGGREIDAAARVGESIGARRDDLCQFGCPHAGSHPARLAAVARIFGLEAPPLDNARSYRSVMQRIKREIPAGGCVAAAQLSKSQIVAFEYLGHYRVDAVTPEASTPCAFLVLPRSAKTPDARWRFVGRERVLRSDIDTIDIYRRSTPPG